MLWKVPPPHRRSKEFFRENLRLSLSTCAFSIASTGNVRGSTARFHSSGASCRANPLPPEAGVFSLLPKLRKPLQNWLNFFFTNPGESNLQAVSPRLSALPQHGGIWGAPAFPRFLRKGWDSEGADALTADSPPG